MINELIHEDESVSICWNDLTEKGQENLIEYLRNILSEKEDE